MTKQFVAKKTDSNRYGNEFVHPGTIDLDESPDDATHLFVVLNMIGDFFYTQPKRLKEAYEKIPSPKRNVNDNKDDACFQPSHEKLDYTQLNATDLV